MVFCRGCCHLDLYLFFSIIFGLGGVILGVAILYFSNMFNVDNDLYMKYCYINKDDKPIPDELKEDYGLYYANSSDKWVSLSEFLKNLLDEEGKWYDKSVLGQ